jgi:flagellar hook assembly protein FlgD
VGSHSVTWNGRDANGAQAATGVYFVRLQAGSYEMTRKIVMLK